MVRAVLSILAALGVAGCIRPGAYLCSSNTDCVLGGVPGVCEPVGYCSFPDVRCADGFRYGEQSGRYAGQCVDQDDTPGLVTIGGDVTGLAGVGLLLRDNGTDDLPIAVAGSFTFATLIPTGDPYDVTVGNQPSSPTQACSVVGGSGIAGALDISDIAVSCTTTTFMIGGTVTGLVGSGLVLTNNGVDDLDITADGVFMFPAKIASGSAFAVAIKTQPAGQTCNVSGATGTVGSGDVSTVVVNCDPATFTIGGTVSGLDGTAVLRNNGTDIASLTANGTFAFPTPLAAPSSFAVTVMSQPAYPPRSQTCIVTGGNGSVGASNVTSVTVTCTTSVFVIAVNVTGLSGSLTVQNNGIDTKTITASGMYAFATAVPSGNAYSVTITAQPSGITCGFAMSPSGTVTNAAVTVGISCSATTDPGILCGTTYCDPASQLCCIANGVAACASSCNGPNTTPLACDTQQDCATAGTGSSVCCGTVSGSVVYDTYCANPMLCDPPKAYYCDPNIADPCPQGGTCTATSSPFPGWYRCF